MHADRIDLLESRNGDSMEGLVDDVVDRLVNRSIEFGGDVVFVEGDELEKFDGVALVTRY